MRDPFLQALPDCVALPTSLRQLHSTAGEYVGHCTIEKGKGCLVSLALRLGGFPPSGVNVPVQLRIQKRGLKWMWERNFDGHVTRSVLSYDAKSNLVHEKFGAVTLTLRPQARGKRIAIEVAGVYVYRIPVPRWFLPQSETFEHEDEQARFAFDVSARLSVLGLLIRYCGTLEPLLS